MIFTATEQQVKEITLNAIKASKVVGMGIYQDRHFKGISLTTDDIELDEDGLYIDYFRGRMIKLGITRRGENIWEIRDDVDVEYQSWGEIYSTVEELINSVIQPKKLRVVFISPEFDDAVALSGDYFGRKDLLIKDFMKQKEIESLDLLLGFFGDWQLYIREERGHPLFSFGKISEVWNSNLS